VGLALTDSTEERASRGSFFGYLKGSGFNKPLCSFFSIVFCVLSFVVWAEDQSGALNAVPNLRHHAGNVYSAGQPNPAAFVEFANSGVTDVINLRSHDEMKEINEEAAVIEAGMHYHNIAVATVEDLNLNNARQLHQLMAQLGNKNTLIHCRSSNRVGALMALRAAWLQGKNMNEALAIGKLYGLTSLEPEIITLLTRPHVSIDS